MPKEPRTTGTTICFLDESAHFVDVGKIKDNTRVYPIASIKPVFCMEETVAKAWNAILNKKDDQDAK